MTTNVRVQGGANLFGLKATRLPNLSTHVTLTTVDGLVVLRLPLPDFDYIEHDDIVFVTIGIVKQTVEGAGPDEVEEKRESGLILPRVN